MCHEIPADSFTCNHFIFVEHNFSILSFCCTYYNNKRQVSIEYLLVILLKFLFYNSNLLLGYFSNLFYFKPHVGICMALAVKTFVKLFSLMNNSKSRLLLFLNSEPF